MKFVEYEDYIEVELPCGNKTRLSHEDKMFITEYPYWAQSGGYVSIKRTFENKYGVYKQVLYLHKAVLINIYGPDKLRCKADHVDRNKFNNRRSNLRFANNFQNGANKDRTTKSSGGYKGVYLTKGNKKYYARIGTKMPGVRKFLGSFETPELAAIAYDNAAIKVWGEFAILNFPDKTN